MAGHQEMWLIQNGRVLAAAKHPDTGIHSVEAKMSMIQWSHPGSRSHFVDPPSSKSICKSSFILFSSPSFCREIPFCRHQPLFFLQCKHKLYDTKSCFEQALLKWKHFPVRLMYTVSGKTLGSQVRFTMGDKLSIIFLLVGFGQKSLARMCFISAPAPMPNTKMQATIVSKAPHTMLKEKFG